MGGTGEKATVVVQVKNIGVNSSGDGRDEESGLILNYLKCRIKRLGDGWDRSKEKEKKNCKRHYTLMFRVITNSQENVPKCPVGNCVLRVIEWH